MKAYKPAAVHFVTNGTSAVCGALTTRAATDHLSIVGVTCKNCIANRAYKYVLSIDRMCESDWQGEGGERCTHVESQHRRVHGKRGRICWARNGCGCQQFVSSKAKARVAA